jgi:hypothetical protein
MQIVQLIIWFVFSNQLRILPHQAQSLPVMSEEPKEKKQKVEAVSNSDAGADENSEHLAPWAERVSGEKLSLNVGSSFRQWHHSI